MSFEVTRNCLLCCTSQKVWFARLVLSRKCLLKYIFMTYMNYTFSKVWFTWTTGSLMPSINSTITNVWLHKNVPVTKNERLFQCNHRQGHLITSCTANAVASSTQTTIYKLFDWWLCSAQPRTGPGDDVTCTELNTGWTKNVRTIVLFLAAT